MPIYSEASKRIGYSQFLDQLARFEVESCTLIPQGLSQDSYGKIVVYPGTVIAKITGSHLPTYGQCIVRVATPSYGPGSDIAYGILRDVVDLTLGPKNVALVVAGTVRESLILDAGTLGTVAAATKTALSDRIRWK